MATEVATWAVIRLATGHHPRIQRRVVDQLADATVASGGSVIDAKVVERLVAART